MESSNFNNKEENLEITTLGMNTWQIYQTQVGNVTIL